LPDCLNDLGDLGGKLRTDLPTELFWQ